MGSDRPHLDPEPEKLRKAAADLRLMYGADTGASVRLDRAAARIAELEAALSAATARAEAAEAEAARLREARDDVDEFMRRLGPRWFLEQNWFPASADKARAALGGDHG